MVILPMSMATMTNWSSPGGASARRGSRVVSTSKRTFLSASPLPLMSQKAPGVSYPNRSSTEQKLTGY
jgi:hypothetical protein